MATAVSAAPALAEESALPGPDDKPAQVFRVDGRRDTVLYCPEGTILHVPAGAFAAADGQPATGLIEVRVREFYQLPDIILANLTTQSGHELLETGGMLHLEARSATGQLCGLRPEAALLLQLPASAPLPGMQLYTGVPTAQHRLDWQRPTPALRLQQFDLLDAQCQLTSRQLQQRLQKNSGYSTATAARLRQETRPAALRRQLRQANWYSKGRLLAYARATLALDATGRVLATNATWLGTADTTLQGATLRALAQLPYQPARLYGPVRATTTNRSSRIAAVAPRKQRRKPPTRLATLPVAGFTRLDLGFTATGQLKVLLHDVGGSGLPPSSAIPIVSVGAARQQLGAAAVGTMSADSLAGYLFSATQLGWINCDRLLQSKAPRVLFTVATPEPAAPARVQLVFRRIRAVLPGLAAAGGYAFPNVPDQESATIVAIRRETGQTYLALQPVILGQRTEPALAYRPVTPAELRQALAQLGPNAPASPSATPTASK
jgi:hypothetical protein